MKEHAIRLRREEIERRLGIQPGEIVFELAEPGVAITPDEVDILRRGLHSLQDEIEKWMKPTKRLPFLPVRPNPHAHHGTTRLSDINKLMKKLESVK